MLAALLRMDNLLLRARFEHNIWRLAIPLAYRTKSFKRIEGHKSLIKCLK
jgi:hypothetical protein